MRKLIIIKKTIYKLFFFVEWTAINQTPTDHTFSRVVGASFFQFFNFLNFKLYDWITVTKYILFVPHARGHNRAGKWETYSFIHSHWPIKINRLICDWNGCRRTRLQSFHDQKKIGKPTPENVKNKQRKNLYSARRTHWKNWKQCAWL